MISDPTSKYLIGIDIGTKHIAAAQLKEEKKDIVIHGLHYQELGDDMENEDVLVSALREVTKSRAFSGRRVVLSIPSKNLSIFPIHFQCEQTGSVEEAILRESEKYLPFPLDEAVIDYPSLLAGIDGNADSYKALVVAIKREDVNRYLSLLKRTGLHVEAFEFSASALMRLHNYLFEIGSNPVILGHIGQSKSLLVIATKESIVVQRDVGWGSGIMIEEFLASIDVAGDRRKARAILEKYGLSYEDRDLTETAQEKELDSIGIERAIYQIITPHIDEFLMEMDKAVSYARVEERPPEFGGIYLYGQANTVSSLGKYVERRMNIRTEIVNPLERIGVSDKRLLSVIPEDAPLAIALGLAMRTISWL